MSKCMFICLVEFASKVYAGHSVSRDMSGDVPRVACRCETNVTTYGENERRVCWSDQEEGRLKIQ
ncbi:hypothetical protein Syun_027742 [Stephania yunnanensis]|uniref:Secreted protein n=1 Tax=Stephania yunnanensis TaxID=152371 RepID=A0AAP0EG65_9MAGN